MKKNVGLLFLCLLFLVSDGKKIVLSIRRQKKNTLLVSKKRVKSIPKMTLSTHNSNKRQKKNISLGYKRRMKKASRKFGVSFPVGMRNSRWRRSNLIRSFKIINKNKIVVKANRSFSKKDFFVEYDANIDLTKLDESIVMIPFILTIIPVVWISNRIYSIKVMDRDLYNSLQEVKKVFRIFYPEQKWEGDIRPEQLVTNTVVLPDEPAVGMLFSGGLDSVDSSMSHSDTKQLLITAWGEDIPLHKTNMWACVRQQCEQFAQDYGHEHTFVKSNFKQFIDEGTQDRLAKKLYKIPLWWMYTSHALAYAGLTAPILASNNISRILIASTFTSTYPSPIGSHPALDNNIRFAGIAVSHDGEDKDRVQKVMNINTICKEKNLPLPRLRVCFGRHPLGGNCLKCGVKCLMTAGNIIAAGQLPEKYGMNISVSEFIKRTKLFFKGSGPFRKGFLKLWEYDLLYLDELTKRTKTNTLSDQEIQLFREFLYSIDFEGLLDSNALTYSPERQKQFELLWKKNTKEGLNSSQERELFAKLWEQNVKEGSEIKLVVR